LILAREELLIFRKLEVLSSKQKAKSGFCLTQTKVSPFYHEKTISGWNINISQLGL